MKVPLGHCLCVLVALLPAGRCLASMGPEVETALLANDWDAVVETLEADESTVGDPIACLILAMVHEFREHQEEANSWFLTAGDPASVLPRWSEWTAGFLDRNPRVPVALYFAADANIYAGDHEAKEQLKLAVKIDREFLPAYFGLARYYKAIGDPKKAVDAYGKVIKLRPEHVKAYFDRGYQYLNIGKEKDAIRDFGKVLELDPTHSGARWNRGNAYLEREKYEEALADFSGALALEPNRAMLHHNIAWVYYKMEDYDRAMAEVAVVLADSIDEDDDEIARGYSLTTLGHIHSKRGDFEQALLDYTSAIEYAPDFDIPYTNRGFIYLENLDDEEKACADFKRACELGSCENYRTGVQRGICE